MISSVFCPKAWNHIATVSSGDLRPCCDMSVGPESMLKDEAGRYFNVRTDSLEAIRNAPLSVELRATILKGERHPFCQPCWSREDRGMVSARQHLGQTFSHVFDKALAKRNARIESRDFPVEYWDLRLGNLCNLKCRSCSPTESSLWLNDWARDKVASGRAKEDLQLKYYGRSLKVVNVGPEQWKVADDLLDWENSEAFFAGFMAQAKDLKRIYFTGGEPLINRQHWRLIEQLIEGGYAKNIHLQYNSNILQLPDDKIELWRHFDGVHVSCSIDGLGPYAEYIRQPTKWSVLRNNIEKLDALGEHVIATWNPTVSVFNIGHLPEMSLWVLRQGLRKINPVMWLNILHGPKHLSCQILPISSKRRLVEKYDRVSGIVEKEFGQSTADLLRRHYAPMLKFLFEVDASAQIPDFIELNDRLDRIQGRYWQEELPELSCLIRGIPLESTDGLRP